MSTWEFKVVADYFFGAKEVRVIRARNSTEAVHIFLEENKAPYADSLVGIDVRSRGWISRREE